MTVICSCGGSGLKPAFTRGIGSYMVMCDCHETCPTCKGAGEKGTGFAQGIGPYPITCPTCEGKKMVPKKL